MMESLGLDLDFNNDRSEVLHKNDPSFDDRYQQAITYAKKAGISKSQLDKMIYSSVNGDEKSSKLDKVLLALSGLADKTKEYGATSTGHNVGDTVGGSKPTTHAPKQKLGF